MDGLVWGFWSSGSLQPACFLLCARRSHLTRPPHPQLATLARFAKAMSRLRMQIADDGLIDYEYYFVPWSARPPLARVAMIQLASAGLRHRLLRCSQPGKYHRLLRSYSESSSTTHGHSRIEGIYAVKHTDHLLRRRSATHSSPLPHVNCVIFRQCFLCRDANSVRLLLDPQQRLCVVHRSYVSKSGSSDLQISKERAEGKRCIVSSQTVAHSWTAVSTQLGPRLRQTTCSPWLQMRALNHSPKNYVHLS
jgi:hypothetical protein